MKQYGIEFDPTLWSLGDELEETFGTHTPAGEGWAVTPEGGMTPQGEGTLNESGFVAESAPQSAPAFASASVSAPSHAFVTAPVFAGEPSSAYMPASAPVQEAAGDSLSEESIERIVERKISELRIYVLESDITEAQKAVRSVVELSKY